MLSVRNNSLILIFIRRIFHALGIQIDNHAIKFGNLNII